MVAPPASVESRSPPAGSGLISELPPSPFLPLEPRGVPSSQTEKERLEVALEGMNLSEYTDADPDPPTLLPPPPTLPPPTEEEKNLPRGVPTGLAAPTDDMEAGEYPIVVVLLPFLLADPGDTNGDRDIAVTPAPNLEAGDMGRSGV